MKAARSAPCVDALKQTQAETPGKDGFGAAWEGKEKKALVEELAAKMLVMDICYFGYAFSYPCFLMIPRKLLC